MRNVKVKNNETLLDVAVLTSGNMYAVFELAFINNISITNDFKSGDTVKKATVLNAPIVGQLVARGARPASAIMPGEGNLLEGIDYWAVWRDFVVQ